MSDPAGYPAWPTLRAHALPREREIPGEDDWERFVSDSGGSSNAIRTPRTRGFWELPDAAKLGAALARWGPFFASPLFAADATRREVEAINSEHSKNLKSDAFRVYQLEKSLFPAAHPSQVRHGQPHDPAAARRHRRAAARSWTSLTLKWIVPFEGEDAAAVQASRLRDRFAKPDLFLSHVLGHAGPQPSRTRTTDTPDAFRLDQHRARSNDDRRADVRRVLDELARIAPLVTVLAPEPEIDGGVTGGAKRRTEPIYGTAYYRAPFAADASPPTSDLFPVPNAYVPTRALAPLHPRKKRVALSDLAAPATPRRRGASGTGGRDLRPAARRRARARAERRLRVHRATLVCAWRSLVNDALRDADYDSGAASYDAALAGLEWTLSSGPRGVALTFGGFDDKLGAFATQTAKALRNLDAADYAPRRRRAAAARRRRRGPRDRARRRRAAVRAVRVGAGLLHGDAGSACLAEEGVTRCRSGPAGWLDDKGGVWGSGGDVEVLAQGNLRKSDAAKLSGELRDVLRLSKSDASTDALLGVLEVPARDKGVLVKRTKAPQADEATRTTESRA
ncbi:M16 peptidase-like protein [Aureococcus anophagefferens]|nr:M16 peptidase-like protein [Aureococcus anophagefferens]